MAMSPTTQRFFMSPTSEMGPPLSIPPPVEGELNLADLINIDEEPGPGQEVSISFVPIQEEVERQESPHSEGHSETMGSERQSLSLSPFSPEPQPQTPQMQTQTGPSPFATRTSYPEGGAPRPSFDLNAIWAAPAKSPTEGEGVDEATKPADLAAATEEKAEAQEGQDEPMSVDSPTDMKVDSPIVAEHAEEPHGHYEGHEQDFDMFLDAGEDEAREKPHISTPEAQQATFEALPQVWSGKVCATLWTELRRADFITLCAVTDQHASGLDDPTRSRRHRTPDRRKTARRRGPVERVVPA